MSNSSNNEGNLVSRALGRKITRRSFIKWSGAIGATASLSGLIVDSMAKGAAASTQVPASGQGGSIVNWIPSHCLVCHGWCGIAVGIDSNDVVRKIEGIGGQPKPGAQSDGVRANLHDDTYKRYCSGAAGQLPYHIHNRGRICAKGNDGMEHLYDPDRVKYPLQRVGDRGSGKWKRISWKDAYTAIGNELRRIGQVNPSSDLSSTAVNGIHRFVLWIGRNEDEFPTNRFSAAYGTPNHIEHTSICESSRHTASIWTMKDKFPLPWVATSGSEVITDPKIGLGTNQWTQSTKDDVDLYVSCGGNITESQIPHASYNQRVADVRRRGGRIIGIDVRQSNTLAYADEFLFVEPGTDGALAAGVMRTIMAYYGDATGNRGGIAALKARLDSRPNIKYRGFFMAEEVASGGQVPNGKSLESYLFQDLTNGTPPNPGGGGTKSAAWAAGVCNPNSVPNGITQADIEYLAWAFSGGFSDRLTATNPHTPGLPGQVAGNPPRNPIIDGYRGPAKHTNGTYNYRLLRAMQTLACGYDDGAADANNGALTEYIKRASCVNRPGGLCHDVYVSGTGIKTDWGNGPGGAVNNRGAGAGLGQPNTSPGGYPTVGDQQRVDNWDYTGTGGSKFLAATHKNDQMVVPGIRASVGLHPFLEGQPNTVANSNPYRSYDNSFKVEALIILKNNPRYSRPNIKLDWDLFTAKDGSGNYLLKNFWAIDIQMGDGSSYADIILPEGPYLERYTGKDWESLAMKSWIDMRQPVRQLDYTDIASGTITVNGSLGSATVTSTSNAGVLSPLWKTRSVWRQLYEIGRAVENTATWGGPADDLSGGQSTPLIGAVPPWNGTLAGSFNFSGVNADKADRDYVLTMAANSSTIPNGGALTDAAKAAAQFNYMRTNGNFFGSADTPNFWKNSYSGGNSSTGVNAIEIYHARLDAVTDPTPLEVGKEGDNTFYGTPVYVPLSQQRGGGYPLRLTTYRLNVHTHARTASCPRLQEIIGNSWAVIHPDDAAARGIANGDTVKVSTKHWDVAAGSVVRTMKIEAKVTLKAQKGVVSVSHSQGHSLASFGGDGAGGRSGYKVSEDGGYTFAANRSLSTYGVGGADATIAAAIDSYRLNLAPTAPSTPNPATLTSGAEATVTGHGTHPNWVINRVSDPIGASQAFFDSACEVVKA